MALLKETINHKKSEIIQLLNEIKEMTGAFGIIGIEQVNRPVELQVEVTRLFELGTPITLSGRESDSFPYQLDTVASGIKWLAVCGMVEVKECVPELWKGFCKDNRLCPDCGKDLVDDPHHIGYMHCEDGCIDPVKF